MAYAARKCLFLFFLSATFISGLSSCEKVINVDIKNQEPKIVVEGNITDEPGLLTHLILVSRSTTFSSEGKFNAVTDAIVIIKDLQAGVTDTLEMQEPGQYYTHKILGISGHTYTLEVLHNGSKYTAASTLPDIVPLDSAYVKDFGAFGITFKQCIPVFQDPPGKPNYYRFYVAVNDSTLPYQEAWDDLLTDGKLNSRPININSEELFKGNDTVKLTMMCTDKASFDFYNTLYNASGNGQTPANPTNNISNGALGYFGAVTVRRQTVIIP